MSTLEGLLNAIVADAQNEDRWLVLADWLEEHDDVRRAELLRLHRRLLATCCEPERYPERAAWQARIMAMLAQGAKPCVPQRTVRLGDGVEMTFNFIPPGTFLMASPEGKEVLHRVTLTKGFWMGIYPVTQAQWQAVMGSSPSKFKGYDRPVEMVSWEDCQGFCLKLAETTGLRFVLPSEAQWEYACRAGTTTAYYTGDGIEAVKRAGWCSYDGVRSSTGGTRPVGQLEPNAWGLFDLHGNVDEWCADWYEVFEGAEVVDPKGSSTGDDRLVRGGSWCCPPCSCWSSSRHCYLHTWRENSVGFRVGLCPDD